MKLILFIFNQVGDIAEGSSPVINNLSAAVDKYLLELAEKQELTVDVLCQLVSVLPVDKRSSHDILYKVVQTLLKSGKAKGTIKI